MKFLSLVFCVLFFGSLKHSLRTSRLVSLRSLFIQSLVISSTQFQIVLPSYSSTASSQVKLLETFDFNDLYRLKRGLKELNYLLDYWNEKTLYCNFGEFQRELLTPENKKSLLAAAAETGLLDYDKSKTMNVMCKRDPQMVRAMLGLTPDNLTLSGADKLLRKATSINRVDPNFVDEYIDQIEKFSRGLSSASALAYGARTDFGSTETVSRQSALSRDQEGSEQSYLDQSKTSVIQVRDALERIVTLLGI
jgi:hypothetical protein